MRIALRSVVIAAIVLLGLRATCGKPRIPRTSPEMAIKLADEVRFHNVSITWNGRHYFTLNGGNSSYCDLNEYDASGRFIRRYDLELDGRAIFYHPTYRRLFVKTYGDDIYQVDLTQGKAELFHEDIFADDNSSPGFSPDGRYIYEMNEGTITVYDFVSGEELDELEVENYYDEHPYFSAIAVAENYLFIWGGEDRIRVHRRTGDYVTEIELPVSGHPLSLSYCNGMLWVAQDADGGSVGAQGYWYGFRL